MSDDEINRPPPEADEVSRTGERSFFTLRNILIFAAVLAVVAAFVQLYAWVLLEFFTPKSAFTEAGQELPPQPRLQVRPAEEYQSYLERERARLEEYAFIDEDAGVVQIPIERAMEMIVDQGLPFEAVPRREQQIEPKESGFGIHITGVPATPEPEGTPIALLSAFFAEEGAPVATPQAPAEGTAAPETGAPAELISQGEQIFQEQGCSACHQDVDSPTAPSLVGKFGQQEQLESGETVTVDEAYVRQSILEPGSQIVQGYAPIMPAFEGRLSEEQLAALVAYIMSLSSP